MVSLGQIELRKKYLQIFGNIIKNYNMICSALFLQPALYILHSTYIMQFRKLSFVNTPAVLSQHCKSLIFNVHEEIVIFERWSM